MRLFQNVPEGRSHLFDIPGAYILKEGKEPPLAVLARIDVVDSL